MKHLLILSYLLISLHTLSAQTISRYVIPTNGSEYKDSNIHVSATVGETFTFTLTPLLLVHFKHLGWRGFATRALNIEHAGLERQINLVL